jgi:diguanylate cyclase (GGDEF)-like protein
MGLDPPPEDMVFLATMPAGAGQRRLALAVVLIAAGLFLIGLPFARMELPTVWAFIPIYESWLIIIDSITAVLLFGQYAILRSRALLVLGGGYLFTATIMVAHALTFPGLFAPHGLLGAGEQTTAWLYGFWHFGFAVAVLGYAVLRGETPEPYAHRQRARVSILACAALVVLVTCLLTLLATLGESYLPPLMRGNQYAIASYYVTIPGWLIGIAALVILWRIPRPSVLDLWVLVVVCVQMLEVGLSSTLDSGRFDLGWYLGRSYGLAAVSFVLLMLLIENGRLYAKLVDGQAELRRLAAIDPLTRVANRRAFDDALEMEWRRAIRSRLPLALLLIDVDRFKSFNDVYGHVIGDRCLQMIASALASGVRRAGEMVARYGGEEFAVLLPGTDLAKASALGRRLLQAVRELDIPRVEPRGGSDVTISVGVACMSPAREADPVDPGPTILVEAGDKALYAAKAAGRNQVAEYVPHVAGLQHEPEVVDTSALSSHNRHLTKKPDRSPSTSVGRANRVIVGENADRLRRENARDREDSNEAPDECRDGGSGAMCRRGRR